MNTKIYRATSLNGESATVKKKSSYINSSWQTNGTLCYLPSNFTLNRRLSCSQGIFPSIKNIPFSLKHDPFSVYHNLDFIFEKLMDSIPVNWEALDALIIEFAKSENLIEESVSSPCSSPSSSYKSRLVIRQIRLLLEAGDIDSTIDLLRLHAPFILDDHRLLFRLHKQVKLNVSLSPLFVCWENDT